MASQARPKKDIATRAMTSIEFGYKRSKLRSRITSSWHLHHMQHPDNQPKSQWIDHRNCLQKKGMWILSALKLGTDCSGGKVEEIFAQHSPKQVGKGIFNHAYQADIVAIIKP